MNKNRGQVIYLRLRYPGDANQFLPLEQVTDTMLHELSHNVFGEHDERFHALWDQLRSEYEGLVSKGYTGEGFLSDGHRLGGRRMPQDEAHRIRRIAAEKRAALTKGSGQKLGGSAVPAGSDMRKVIADAIARRSNITKGCASGGNKGGEELEAISEQASKNGFKTKAEEDEANETAIAQALWELHQEDEKKKYGSAYVPPTAADSSRIEQAAGSDPPKPRLPPPPRNNSRLVLPLPAKRPAPSPSHQKSKPNPTPIKDEIPAPMKYWTCPTCTFAENPVLHLCCDICAAEIPENVARSIFNSSVGSKKKVGVSSGGSSAPSLKTWMCRICSNEMESQWWTCSTCGTLKSSSKD